MSIFVNKNTRLLVQGITGKEGQFHTRQCVAYGTQVVAGVTPGKAGQKMDDIPVFHTVKDAVKATGANCSAVTGTPAVHLCFGNYGGQTVQKGTWDQLMNYLNALHADHIVMECAHRPPEELAAFKRALGSRFTCFVKRDHLPAADEPVEDDLLIRADKNPNSATAHELFGEAPIAFPDRTDLVLVWGEGVDFASLPRGARVILLGSYLAPENGHADVFVPISIQTERAGHYTNFAGVASRFERCFAKQPGIADAEEFFGQLAVTAGAT